MNANHMTIGFIGLGLIGGSIAKTIRRIHPDSIIYGFDTDIDVSGGKKMVFLSGKDIDVPGGK